LTEETVQDPSTSVFLNTKDKSTKPSPNNAIHADKQGRVVLAIAMSEQTGPLTTFLRPAC